jgi:hypothetical protein
MKAFIYAITLLLFTQICSAQRVYQIRADSVRIYNTCDTAELIIENRTKDTLGFLYNKGNGRTEFRKLRLKAVNGNSIAIAGQDTLLMSNVIKVAVDTLYQSGNTLFYRRTNGVTQGVDLSVWGDGRYAKKNVANTTTSGVGWYRIATNGPLVLNSTSGAGSGTDAYGRFIITADAAGMHQTVEFIASINYAAQPILKLVNNTDFANYPFAAIRLVKATTYDGFAIEVLTTRTEALTVRAVLLDNEQQAGWSPINWTKTTSLTGVSDGLPAGFSQINISLNTRIAEGATDSTGSYWSYVRGAGLQTTGGFRQRSALGMVGNGTTTSQIIWTVGDANTSIANYTGIGYEYSNSVTGTYDHEFVMSVNGFIVHKFGLSTGAMLGGPVKVNGIITASGTITAGGIITAPGFYQSSLRSLKKDITAFNLDALKLISGLKIVEFTYKDDKEELRHTGIIADESDAHFATKNHDKFDTNSAVSITMKAVQELTEKLEQLNKRIEELEKKIK